jgi:RND family efflux transporter MFP subunit
MSTTIPPATIDPVAPAKPLRRSGRAKRLLALGLVVAGGMGLMRAVHYRPLERLVHAEQAATFEVKKRPFVRRVTAEGYLRAVKATGLAAPMQTEEGQKIAWMAPDGSNVKKGDVVIRFDPSEHEKKLRDGEADRASANAKIDKEQILRDSAMRGRGITADLAKAELAGTRAFQKSDSEIFSKNQIIESAIDEGLSAAKLAHADEAAKIEKRLSQSKVDLIEVEKRKAQLHVSQAQQGLSSLEVRAPHDGIVVFEQDWRGNLPHVGDSVWAGQTLARLPLLDEMESEVFVLEADAAGLAVGNAATVVLEAHPDPAYEGKITRIDTLAKPRQREVPIQYFGATLELSRTVRELMKPGERVHATLVLDQSDALAVPRQAVFEREGKKVVYRWRDGKFTSTPVTVGASSPGLVVIEEGLSDGDRIALRDPTKSADSAPAAKDGNKDPGASGPSAAP